MSAPLTIQVRLGFSMGWRIWSPNEVRFYTKTLAHSYFIYNILRSKLLSSRIWIVNYSIFVSITKYSIFLEYLRFGLKHKEESLRWNKLVYLSLAVLKKRGNKDLNSKKFFFLKSFKKKFKNITLNKISRHRRVPNNWKRSKRKLTKVKFLKTTKLKLLAFSFKEITYKKKFKKLKPGATMKKKNLVSCGNVRRSFLTDPTWLKKRGTRLRKQEIKKPRLLLFFYGGMYPSSFRKLLRSFSSKKVVKLREAIWFWQKLALMVSFFINRLENKESIEFIRKSACIF